MEHSPLLTTAEAARACGTTPRVFRHHVKAGRIVPKTRVGGGPAMLFDPLEVAALSEQIRTVPSRQGTRRTDAVAVPSMLGLGLVPSLADDGALTPLGAFAASFAATLVIVGIVGTIRDRRADRARTTADHLVGSIAMPWSEYAALQIAESTVTVCPHRGRVYRCCDGQWWRSSYGNGWCFARGGKLTRVERDDSTAHAVVVAALETRDRREQLSVVA